MAPITISVVNLKGGTSKTTTAVFLSYVLHEWGRRVLLIDSDPQHSAVTWHEFSPFPFRVAEFARPTLHREMLGTFGEDRFDAFVIDTPPTEHDRGIAESALRAATHIVVPVAPTAAEFQRFRALRTLLDDAAHARRGDQPPAKVAVLLVRTVATAASTEVYRELMTEDGWTVLRPTVGRLERYAQAFAGPVERAAQTAYGDAATELLTPSEVPA